MSREQIQKLYFPSLVRANARLRLLFDHRFVARYYPPAVTVWSAGDLLTGQGRALPVVARRLDWICPRSRAGRASRRRRRFIEHTLATWTSTSPSGRRSESAGTWRSSGGWANSTAATSGTSAPRAAKWRKEAFKPDGFVRLLEGDTYHNFFIEADLGHTSSRQFLGKLLTHQRYLESGLYERTFGGDSFRTLVVTTGTRRAGNLRGLVEQQQSDLFWFATLEDVRRDVLGPVWQAPSVEESVRSGSSPGKNSPGYLLSVVM
jgi:hypothetical protein